MREKSNRSKSNYDIEVERKYKVQWIENTFNLDFQEFEIFQTYLKTARNQEERVRKLKSDNVISYSHTIKKPISNTERTEIEKTISDEEYEILLKRKDEKTKVIHKIRKVFIYKNQSFELDTYLIPTFSFQILEIENVQNHIDIDFPEFIKIIEDVTGDKTYSNYELSRKTFK